MAFVDVQKKVKELWGSPFNSIGDYLIISRDLKNAHDGIPSYFRKIKAAFLGTFTLQGLPEIFSVRAIFHNLYAETYLAPYNQVAQEIINRNSGLYAFQPDIVYLAVDGKDILDIKEFDGWIGQLCASLRSRLVIFNFASGKTDEFNAYLSERYKNSDQVSVFDFSGFVRRIGEKDYWDTKYTKLGDFRLAPAAFPQLAEALAAYAVAAAGARKKCLVLDLDNTVWQGIIGEDGMDGLSPNEALQKQALAIFEKGVILAINSKNNIEDAMEVLEKHPKMLLRKDNFAAWRINWQSKDRNIRELAEELNLGLDSFVFVDDDPFQRNLVSGALPEVTVLAPELLGEYVGFHSFKLTNEDIRRGQMYIEERDRKEYASAFASMNDFLKNLNLEVVVAPADENTVSRISQLTQKTNQFNLTTRRYSEADIRGFLKKGWKIWSLSVKDRFGDYGVTGLAMIDPHSEGWRMDNFLLSCRVLGRGVEQALFSRIAAEAFAAKAKKITAEFIPTAKNKTSENFLTECRFKPVKKVGEASMYQYDLSVKFPCPDFIKLINL